MPHVLSVMAKKTPTVAQWVEADQAAVRASGHAAGCDCVDCVGVRVEAVRAAAAEDGCYEWIFTGHAAGLAIIALDTAICTMTSRRRLYMSWRAACSCGWKTAAVDAPAELMGPCAVHLIGASL